MRLGLLLWVALMAMALSGAVWAESEPVVVETVDAGDAMQSFAPDLSGLSESDAFAGEPEQEESAPDGELGETDADGSNVWAEPDGEFVDEAEANALDAADETAGDEEAAWDEFDDPDFGAASETPSEAGEALVASDAWPEDGADAEATEPLAAGATTIEEGTSLVVNGVTLGPVGVDADGRVGRVHTVQKGDTLWDVSQAYLGTAWVWPSVWNENDSIQNPHLIEPGDRLWISSTEIRAITDAEAEAYLAGAEALEEPEVETVAAEIPEDFEFEEALPEDDEFMDMASMDEFAGDEMDALPVGMPDEGSEGNDTGRTVSVSMRENMSFVSDVQLKASTTILGSPSDRKYLAMLDTIYFGLGEGEVEVGDQFTFFRNITDVRSPSTKELLGYHVDVLGWAEVVEITGDTCVAVIRVSIDGAIKGDRVMPRYQPPTDVAVKYPQEQIDGEIAFLPASRTLMGTTDYVFLDVGAVHGVEIGTDLEVYDAGRPEYDGARDVKLRTPDRVVADLVVVTVQEESAVAFVAHTKRELAVGDAIRGATRDYPHSF